MPIARYRSLWYFFTMLLSTARHAPMPETIPLINAPLLAVPMTAPPIALWVGVGRHGTMAREDYRLPELWCVHLYRWTGALRAGEVTMPVRPGYASIVPPNTPLSHYFRTEDPPAIHLSFGFRLADMATTPAISLPMMRDTGAQFGAWNALLEKAIGVFAAEPRRAEALLWELLWRLAEQSDTVSLPQPSTGIEPFVVVRTRESIELRLAEPLRVAELARAVDLSHNHLIRLFHAATGRTIVEYIRERRIERATRLLQHTTMPIKQIAAQVGLPDLHQFNKVVRAATGCSPRALREAGIAQEG